MTVKELEQQMQGAVEKMARLLNTMEEVLARATVALGLDRKAGQRPSKRHHLPFGTMPAELAWMRRILAPALATRRYSPERNAVIAGLAAQDHVLASGERTRLSRSIIYDWLRELETEVSTSREEQDAPRQLMTGTGAGPSPAPDGGAPPRTQIASVLPLIGNPVQLSKDYAGDDSRRKMECPAYKHCLAHAARHNWADFTCEECTGPGHHRRRPSTRHAKV